MKTILLAMTLSFIVINARAQYVYKIKADSVFVTNDSCHAELIIENTTKDTLGFLFNKGNGRTEFRRALIKVNDSVYIIGSDTLKIATALNGPGGATGAVQFNRAGKFGGDAAHLYWDTLNRRLHVGGNNPETQLTITGDSLGADILTETDGITLINTTAATSTQQQRSPAIRFVGQGWKTVSPAASQQVEIRNYLEIEQGSVNPMYKMIWEEQRNNGTRYPVMILGEHGLNVMGLGGATGGLSFTNAAPVANTVSGGNSLNFRTHYTTDTTSFSYLTTSGFSQTSGNIKFLRLFAGSNGFFPSSGTANYSLLSLEPTINQTGTANGITRALHIKPDIVSAVDFRAIQVDEGKSYFRSIHLTSAGDKINIATGTNSSIGIATLSGGTVTVNTTAVATGSTIILSYNTPSGTTGQLSAPAASIVNGTSFVINSSAAGDNSTINYLIIN